VGHSFIHRNKAAGLMLNRRGLLLGGLSLASASPVHAALGSPGDTLDEILARGTIRIGMYSDFAPYSYLEGGEIKGIDVAVANIIAEALKVKPELELRNADEDVDSDLRSHVWRGPLAGGDVVNVMLHMPIDPALALRNDMVLMGGAFASEKTILAWSKFALGDLPTLASFTDNQIAVENSSIGDFFLASYASGALVKNIVHKRTIAEAVKAMVAGEVTALIGPMAQIEYELHKATDKPEKYGVGKVSPPGLSQGNWSFGFAVRMNYHDLFYAVEDAITAAIADGRIKAAYEKFGLTYNPPAKPKE
jgi:polar amino acid transport system substrate-binding protein